MAKVKAEPAVVKEVKSKQDALKEEIRLKIHGKPLDLTNVKKPKKLVKGSKQDLLQEEIKAKLKGGK